VDPITPKTIWKENCKRLVKQKKMHIAIIDDEGDDLLSILAALYLTKDGHQISLLNIRSENYTIDDEPIVFSYALKQMLIELELWKLIKLNRLPIEQVIDWQYTFKAKNKSLYSILKSELRSILYSVLQYNMDQHHVELTIINSQELNSFEILKDGSIVRCVYQTIGEKQREIDTDLVLCMSEVLYSELIMGDSTKKNRCGLTHFYDIYNIEALEYYQSSCVNNGSKQSAWSSFSSKYPHSYHNSGAVSTASSDIIDPNMKFINDGVTVDNNTSATQIVALQTQTSTPNTLFSSFKPRLFYEDNSSIGVNTVVKPDIHVIQSSDKLSTGVFVPLSLGKKGSFILSKQHQLVANQLQDQFSAFSDYLKGSTNTIRQIVEIDCKRRDDNVHVLCLGRCKYGTSIHPLFQTNAYFHELYSLVTLLRNSER
jgi:hypothetical protein